MPDGPVAGDGEIRIGVYVCHCGTNIAGVVDVESVARYAARLPHVVVARAYRFMCSDPGQDLIVQDIAEQGLNRIVVAACSPLLHEVTFRNATRRGGINPFNMQMVSIREHASWVHEDAAAATQKARSMIHGAVQRVAWHEDLEVQQVRIHPDVLVVGGGIGGIHAALTLAQAGKKVTLVEREPSIGGNMARFDKTFPTLDCAACILTPKMTAVKDHPNITLWTCSEVEAVDGYVGNFTVKVRRRARYVNEDTCTACGECAQVCPISLPSEFDLGLGLRKAIYQPFAQAVPNTYRISRLGVPPCRASCPIHQNAQAYVGLIAQGKFGEALQVILRDNPLPSVCGRICTHPCMLGCTRDRLDDPLNLPALKRFVTDRAGDFELPRPAADRRESIGVVGSGPAGLMCAYVLRQKGYRTVVYEALPMAGGMLAVGVPEFRLPRDVLAAEIARFERIGVEFRLEHTIGESITLADLQGRHSAVFVAIGAWVERRLGLSGETLPRVEGGIEFLTRVKRHGDQTVGRRVLVVGGGNSALDAARTAVRCGAEEVTLVYRRTRAEMPADPLEVAAAEGEGVKLHLLAAPVEIRGEDCPRDMICQRMRLGAPDASGRPRPVPIEGSEFVIPCDQIIVTIGQVPDLEKLGNRLGLKTSRGGTFAVDPVTLETNVAGVFAGGDCVTGPDVVVNAMLAGKKAAESIDRLLTGRDLRLGRELEGPYESTVEADIDGYAMRRQVPMPAVAPELRANRFDEVHTGYTEKQAREEAARCLQCAQCCDCRLCATVCDPQAIDYAMEDTVEELEVGAIVLATGFEPYDPRRSPEYGYGVYDEVYTALELERIVNSAGPTGGRITTRDGRRPRAVAIVHCVGSRDERTNRWCSRVCCMASLKLAHLIREHTGAEVYNFYIDIRAPGKGYEEFYDRIQQEDVHFIRGKVAEVTDWAVRPEEEGRLVIRVEDSLAGFVRRIPVDMVVLATGMEPQADADQVRRLFGISCSTEGFYLERHPKLAPVSTFTDGVFLAGCCQGPKDIPDTVAQAGAAAAEALALIDRGHVEIEPNTAHILEQDCSGCKSCIPLCPYGAISFVEEAEKAQVNEAVCKGCGTCVAACPSGSIVQKLFTDQEIFSEISGLLEEEAIAQEVAV